MNSINKGLSIVQTIIRDTTNKKSFGSEWAALIEVHNHIVYLFDNIFVF